MILLFATVEGVLTWRTFKRAAIFNQLANVERVFAERAERSLAEVRRESDGAQLVTTSLTLEARTPAAKTGTAMRF